MVSNRMLRMLVASFQIVFLSATFAGAADLPPGVKTLQVNGYPMAYVESGNGVPAVMVHGALSDYRSWDAQMKPLSQAHRAIAVSLRHYFPEKWDGKGATFSWQQHVADVIAFVKALNAGPIHLIGHSRGGLVAVEVALAEPDLIRSLVLAEPGVILDESGFGSQLQQSASAKGAAVQRAARVKAVLSRFEQGDIDGGLEIFVDDVGGAGSWSKLTDVQRQMFRDNAWTVKGMEDERRRPVRCQDLQGLSRRVLLVGGERSPARYGEILKVIEPCFKQARRATIPNASHGMHRMNPTAFNDAVIASMAAD